MTSTDADATLTQLRYRRRHGRVRVYMRCGPVGCSIPLLAAIAVVVLVAAAVI